jgi:hypothetical protein
MYTSENSNARDTRLLQPNPVQTADNRSSSVPSDSVPTRFGPTSPPFDPSTMPPPPVNAVLTPDPELYSDAGLLLNLRSPFSASSPNNPLEPLQSMSFTRGFTSAPSPDQQQPTHAQQDLSSPTPSIYPNPSDYTFGDMVIDSQEVDLSLLGADMMRWDLDYLPHDMLFIGDGAFGMDDTGTGASEG